MNRYDFLVVGGGPVGCRVAMELSQAGHRVAVLEKRSALDHSVCCTGIVSCECMHHFGIPNELILNQFHSASIYTPKEIVLHLERKEMQAVAIDRGAFNAYMARRAQDCGADYLLGQCVSDIKIHSDGVHLCATCNGTTSYFDARAVVLACGFASRLPSGLNLGKARGWTVGAQVEVTTGDLQEVEIYIGRALAPGYFAWLVPVGRKRALAGLMAERQSHMFLSDYISFLRTKGRLLSVNGSPSYRGITLRAPAHISGARVLLVGDAAGQVKPLTGGGLYFGLLCADIAVSILHQAMETGEFATGNMRLYDKKCTDLLGRELRLGRWGHRLYSRMSDERIERLARWAQRNNLPARLSASSRVGFDWHGSAMLNMLKEIVCPF